MNRLFVWYPAILSGFQVVPTYAKTTVWLTVFAVFCLYTQSFAQQKKGQIKKEVRDSLLTVDGKTVIVEQEVWKLNENPDSFERTLKSYSLRDSVGTSLFSRSFPETKVTEYGFNAEFSIRMSTISTPARDALIIYHAAYPSAPGSGIELQLFAWQDDVLVPLSKPLNIYGRFGEIKRKHEGFDIPLADTETILMTQHIAYHFYVDIPVIINLDPSAKSSYRTALPKDPGSGLKVIPVTAEVRKDFVDDKREEITLYKSARGKESVSIQVDRESMVEIGPAFGIVKVSDSEQGAGVSFEVKRLKVTIDKKTGFVEEKDYVKLGLPAFG